MRGRKSLGSLPKSVSSPRQFHRKSDINNSPIIKEKLSGNQDKSVNAIDKLKRKMSTAFIPSSTLSEFNKHIHDIKTRLISGFKNQRDLDEFWDTWDKFESSIYNYFSNSTVKSQSKQIRNELESSIDSLQNAKKQVQSSSPQLKRMIREISKDIQDMIKASENVKDFSSSFLQQFVDDLNTIKPRSPTSEFKSKIGISIVLSQKLRDIFKFKEFILPLLQETQEFLVEYTQDESNNFETKENNVVERRLSIDPSLNQEESSSEDYESLQAKIHTLENENDKLQQEIDKYNNLVEQYEESLRQTNEEIDSERSDLKRKLKEQKKKYLSNPSIAANSSKIEELELKLSQLENEIENRKKYGDGMMNSYFNGEIRSIKIKIENATKEFESVKPINENFTTNDNVDIKIANGRLLDRNKELSSSIKQEKKAFSELRQSLEQSYEISEKDDFESQISAYNQSVLIGSQCVSIASQITEDNDKMKKKIKKVLSQKADTEDSISWLKSLKNDFDNLQSRMNEINSKKEIPTIESLNQQLEDKNSELKKVSGDKKPVLTSEIKKLIQETKKISQNFLSLANQHAETETKSKSLITEEIQEPTEHIKQAYSDFERLNYEKSLANEEMVKLFKLVTGNDSDDDFSFEQMASTVLKKISN